MPDKTTGPSYNPTVVLYFIILHTKSEWEFNMDKEICYNTQNSAKISKQTNHKPQMTDHKPH